MNVNDKFFEQGDVCIVKITDFDKRKKSIKNPNNGFAVLAEGETTGHAHRISKTANVELYDDLEEKCLLLRLLKPATVRHEEHKEIEIPAGDYKINIVREYDHFAEEARKVAD